MKLTLRPEWRPRIVSSLFGFIELKTGVRIAILFAMLNKVAGVYGLITIFTGGNLAQLSMYFYSVIGLAAYVWGLKAIKEEDTVKSMQTAHLFLVDHILNSIWLAVFAVDWWFFNPHDGARTVNSPAQQEVIEVGPGHSTPMTTEERLAAAQGIWNQEKGLAGLILALGWFSKVYFAIVLYSYAIHLRKGTYRSLPLTVAATQRTTSGDPYSYNPVYENELEDGEAGYDLRKPSDRRRADRDIDFDVEFDDLDGTDDLERGRVRGRRAGASLSVGGASEMMTGSRSSNPAPNGRPSRVPSKPVGAPSTRSPPKSSPLSAKDKGKSRAIQQELEQSGAVESWDDDDDTDASANPSRARTPVNGPSTTDKR